MQQIEITREELIEWYDPRPGFVLVEKDKPGERMGRIHFSNNSMAMGQKYAGTGVIRKVSKHQCGDPADQQAQELCKVGGRVAFTNTTPLDINLPAFCTFGREHSNTLFVVLHAVDCLFDVNIPEERLREMEGGTVNA